MAKARHDKWRDIIINETPETSKLWIEHAARWALKDPALSPEAYRQTMSNSSLHDRKHVAMALAALTVHRDDWPQDKPVIDHFNERYDAAGPMLALAVREKRQDVLEHLMTPNVIARSLARKGVAAEYMADLLLEGDKRLAVGSLLTSSSEGLKLREDMLSHNDANARTIALASMSKQSSLTPEQLKRAMDMLADEDPYVQASAIRTLGIFITDPVKLEQTLAPVLNVSPDKLKNEQHKRAVLRAMGLLVQPAMREFIDSRSYYVHLPSGESVFLSYSNRHDDSPIRPIRAEPEFLPAVRELNEEAYRIKDQSLINATTLLLGQYGDEAMFERLFEQYQKSPDSRVAEVLLCALPLTRDAKYLAVFKDVLKKATDSYELRNLLKYLRGVRGSEARELRRAVNEKLRQAD